MSEPLHPAVGQADMILRHVARGPGNRIRVEPAPGGSRAIIHDGEVRQGELEAPGDHEILVKRFKILSAIPLAGTAKGAGRVAYPLEGKTVEIDLTVDGLIVELRLSPGK